MHVIGVLMHAAVSQLMLLTMTDDHATGANHVIEAIHRVVSDKAKCGPLPRTFFFQVDN